MNNGRLDVEMSARAGLAFWTHIDFSSQQRWRVSSLMQLKKMGVGSCVLVGTMLVSVAVLVENSFV
jgi:hypothetical protein